MAKIAPLSGGFMITSIVGFLASVLFVYDASVSWGVTFMIFFAIMFIASIISMTKYPVAQESFKRKIIR